MTNSALFALLIAGLVGLAVAFGGPPDGNQVSFAFKNLPDLPDGFAYQAWVVDTEDELISLGRFRKVGNARNFEYFGDLHRQNRFLVSLETGDPDGVGDLNGTKPDLILFGGKISVLNNIVHLSLISPDLETPSGGIYVLGTPTDDTVNGRSKLKAGVRYNDANEEQGIWFHSYDHNANNTLTSGLALPVIPSNNFVYEGWVISPGNEAYVSTGRFSRPDIPDYNSGQSPYDGGRVHLGPGYPGEDFVNAGVAVGKLELPLSLNQGWQTSISIEPNSDADAMPFVLVPWTARIGMRDGCFRDTVMAQPNPRIYQGQKCAVDPRYDGVAVIH